jgi:hypothetical protein
MSYEAKDVIQHMKGDGRPHRVPPIELAKQFASVIPNGCSTEDVLHAMNIMLGEAIARSGVTLADRKSVAETLHFGLMNNIEMTFIVEGRIKDIKAKLIEEGRELSAEEFRDLVTSEFKKAADEVRATVSRKATERGLQ